LSVGEYDGVIALHGGNYVVPGDLVATGFIFGSGDDFVEVVFWRSGARGFCASGIEFDGLGTRG